MILDNVGIVFKNVKGRLLHSTIRFILKYYVQADRR